MWTNKRAKLVRLLLANERMRMEEHALEIFKAYRRTEDDALKQSASSICVCARIQPVCLAEKTTSDFLNPSTLHSHSHSQQNPRSDLSPYDFHLLSLPTAHLGRSSLVHFKPLPSTTKACWTRDLWPVPLVERWDRITAPVTRHRSSVTEAAECRSLP